MSRYIALFIILSLTFFGCSSPTEKALKDAKYNAFKNSTIQTLSTAKTGDFLFIGKSCYFIRYNDNVTSKIYAYSLPAVTDNEIHYTYEEIISMFGEKDYYVVHSYESNWKDVAMRQLLGQ